MDIWLNDFLFNQMTDPHINLYPAPSKTVQGVKWGYINEKGKMKIKQIYDHAMDFQENGLAIVEVNGKFGLIKPDGTYLVQPRYESIYPFSEGRAVVIDDEGFKVIDEKGKIVTIKPYTFIGSYSNDRAVFSQLTGEGSYLYGYLDRQGKEIIPAKYILANDFYDEKAVVKTAPQEFALINKNGETLYKYQYSYVGNHGNGLLPFKEKEDGKFGYIDFKGNVVIPPQFTMAQPFEFGFAVVNVGESFKIQYKLIDTKGNFIFPESYNDIRLLSKNRAAIGIPRDKDWPYLGSKYALATVDGKILTDFKFSSILDFKGGLASAWTGEETFFITKNGTRASNFPIVQGDGTLSLEGSIIRANVDQRMAYYNRSGQIIWQQNKVISLNHQYKVIEEKFKGNHDDIIYYPQMNGIKDPLLEQRVNEELKKLTLGIYENLPADGKNISYTGDFSIEFFKKPLVVIKIEGYEYPYGAAHGMPSRIFALINLENGRFYKLEDLFKPNSAYVKVLSDIIQNQIEHDEQYSYVFPDAFKEIQPDQPFFIDGNNLYLYFAPYEIAPYAASFPTFKIPFADIMDIIDTDGEFWKSFHRQG